MQTKYGRVVLCALFMALSTRVLALTCDATCTGMDPANPVSCFYCPSQCGTCGENGVITQCNTPGTVHIGMDGAPISSTNAIMDVLASKNVKATFFLVGQNVQANAFTIQRMLNEGHYVASNSYTRLHANSLTVDQLQTTFANDELAKTKAAIQSAVSPAYSAAQCPVKHYRAPYAELNKNVLSVVKSQGYTPVLWNLDLNDWSENQSTMQNLLTTALTNNDARTASYILLYTGTGPVAQAFLPSVIDQMRAAGYTFVSAQDCYGAPAMSSTGSTTGGSSSSTNSGSTNNGGSSSTNTTRPVTYSSPAAAAEPSGLSMQLLVTIGVAFGALLAWAF